MCKFNNFLYLNNEKKKYVYVKAIKIRVVKS